MKFNKFILPILLAIITILLFGRVIWFDFLTFDDYPFIVENPIISDPDVSFYDCLMYRFQNADYFPLRTLIYKAEYNLFGFNSMVFHGFNLFIYVLNVLLVFQLSLKVFRTAFTSDKTILQSSFLVAFFFAIHPLHVESAAWVIDLKDLLLATFYLLGLLFYWKWLDKGKFINIAFAVLFSILSLLSKATAITFVSSIVLVDFLNKEKYMHKLLYAKIPFIAVALFGMYITGVFSNFTSTLNGLSSEAIASTELAYFPAPFDQAPLFIQRLFIAVFRIVFWLFQTIIPRAQTIMYERDLLLNDYSKVAMLLPMLLLFVISWTAIKYKRYPMLAFGFFFYLFGISPVLIQSDFTIATFVPDRYMYLPILGLLYAIVWIFMSRKKWFSYVLICVFTLLWGYKTISYLPVLKTSENLFNNIIHVNPENKIALSNRSIININSGEFDNALIDLNKLVVLKDTAVSTYFNRGKILMDKGESEKALADFNAVLRIDPSSIDGRIYRGAYYLSQNEYTNARADLLTAYASDTSNYMLLKNLARYYFETESYKESISFCDKAKMIRPIDIEITKIKANSYFYLNEFEKCEEVLNAILVDGFKNSWFWNFRSVTRFQEGKIQGAYNDYLKAKELGFKVNKNYEATLITEYNLSH